MMKRWKILVISILILAAFAVVFPSSSAYGSGSCDDVYAQSLLSYENSGTPYVAAPIGKKCLIVFDGFYRQEISTDAPATIREGRTLVPMRFFLEAIGARLWWVPAERKVVVALPLSDEFSWDNVRMVSMWIGKSDVLVDDAPLSVDVPPQIIGGRTFVPLRFVGEVSGWVAEWDGDARIAIIHR